MAAGSALMIAACLLLTNCSSTRAVSGTQVQSEPEITLSGDIALLHIYRVGKMAGAAIGYDVHLGDDVIFRAKNNSKATVKLTSAGACVLWAKTESKAELPLNIELGKEYYVRCGMKMGAMVGRPNLEIVEGNIAKVEFDKIK